MPRRWWVLRTAGGSLLTRHMHTEQADFVRNGNAKQIMSMSKDHTTALWNAVQDSELPPTASLSLSLFSRLRLL